MNAVVLETEITGFNNEILLHWDMLYRHALQLTRDPTRAQDLLHDTYEDAIRFQDRFEQGTYIKAWLSEIMRNIFLPNTAENKENLWVTKKVQMNWRGKLYGELRIWIQHKELHIE